MLRIFKRGKGRVKKAGCEGERRGRSIIVDCEGCIHDSTLEDTNCMRNLSRLMIDEGDADRLILRRGRDREYHGDALKAMGMLSRLSSACLGPASAPVKGRGCRDCEVSPDAIFNKIWMMMPDPSTADSRQLLASIRHEEDRCHRCVKSTLDALDRLDYLHQNISFDVSRIAFRVLEG